MTTFTATSDDSKPCITINPLNTLSKIEPNIYAGFTEHMGRCIYGGLYYPSSPFADKNGFRTDVIDSMKELRVPTVRYPGGNFTATYKWQDGIGPKEKRPRRPELAWLGTESNQMGTDEFMEWCKLVGCEPYLCFNMGTGTLEDALAWLEYCNGKGDTHYANLRRQNGHEEPYNVKYWAVGNEVWGPWQVEETTKEAYAFKAWQWAKALKLLDPTITLVFCGMTGTNSWDWHIIQQCVRNANHSLVDRDGSGQLMDMLAVHIYTASEMHVPNVMSALAAELAIQTASHMIDMARIENKVPPHVPKPKICFDEWNVWDAVRAPGHLGAEESYTLSDALAVSLYLSSFIRQSQHLGMCNIAQSVNVIAPLLTHPTDPSAPLLKQTIYFPYLLFSKYMRGTTLAVHLRCPEYDGKDMHKAVAPDGTDYAWMQSAVRMPWLDVSATVSDGDEAEAEGERKSGKWVCLAVTNVSEERDFAVEMEITGLEKGKEVKVYEVCNLGQKDPWVKNTWEERENVGVRERTWKAEEMYTFPRLSLTLLRWKI